MPQKQYSGSKSSKSIISDKNSNLFDEIFRIDEIIKKKKTPAHTNTDNNIKENVIKENVIKDNNEEIWKFCPDKLLENRFEISNKGRIRDKISHKIISQNIKNGYYYFTRNIDGKLRSFRMHRLIALQFVPNPYPNDNNIVNHLDGNKLNNNYTNLEWTTASGNNQHAADNKLTGTTTRRIGQYIDGELHKEYNTLTMASQESGIHMSRIVEVCKGMRTEYKGIIFKYLDENPNEKVIDPEKEGFKQVKSFPNYWVSEDGRVYSNPFKKFMKQNKHRSGCLQIQLTKRNPDEKGQIKRTVLVHNLVAGYFLGKCPKDCNAIHHIDGNRTNNNINNLKWKYVPGITFTKI